MKQASPQKALEALVQINTEAPLGDALPLPKEIKEMFRQLSLTGQQILTGPQLRAARGMVDWTRAEIAAEANISPETVKNIEHGTFRPGEQTCQAIIDAFAKYGVHFFHLPFLNVAGVAVTLPKSETQSNHTVKP